MSEALDIYKKLTKIRQELGPVSKDAVNPYFESNYATLNQVIETIKPVLNKHGIEYWQSYLIFDGKELFLTRLFDLDTGQKLDGHIPFVFASTDMQKVGSAISYARRYGLLCALGLYQEDDDGNSTIAKTSSQNKNSVASNNNELHGSPFTPSGAGSKEPVSDLSQYVIKFGKFKDLTFSEVDEKELRSYADYWSSKNDTKPLNGPAKEFLTKATAYLHQLNELGNG